MMATGPMQESRCSPHSCSLRASTVCPSTFLATPQSKIPPSPVSASAHRRRPLLHRRGRRRRGGGLRAFIKAEHRALAQGRLEHGLRAGHPRRSRNIGRLRRGSGSLHVESRNKSYAIPAPLSPREGLLGRRLGRHHAHNRRNPRGKLDRGYPARLEHDGLSYTDSSVASGDPRRCPFRIHPERRHLPLEPCQQVLRRRLDHRARHRATGSPPRRAARSLCHLRLEPETHLHWSARHGTRFSHYPLRKPMMAPATSVDMVGGSMCPMSRVTQAGIRDSGSECLPVRQWQARVRDTVKDQRWRQIPMQHLCSRW